MTNLSPVAEAVKWLQERNGTGVFAEKNHTVLIAAGERAPFMRATWTKAVAQGFAELGEPRNRRLSLTEKGRACP